MNVEASKRELAILEQAATSAKRAPVALGDWDELLKQPAESLPALLEWRAIQFSKQSRHTDAAQAANKLREVDKAPNGQLYNAACVLSLAAASIKAAEGEELTAAQTKQRQTWIDQALAALKQSIDAGWDDFAHLQKDPDLAILRDLPEFQALLPK